MLFWREPLARVPRMLRARRIVGWFLAATVACFAAVVLAANLYVQSQGTQVRIQQELSQRLGMPLRIGRISVTPWGGLKLTGIVIPQSNPTAAPSFLEADSFRLRVQFHSIFHRPLVIKEVALIKPQVTWAQNEAGKWRLPSNVAAHSGAPASLPGARSESENAAGRARATPVPPASRPGERESSMPQSEIKRVKLTDGSFHFLDRQSRNVARFEGVGFSSTMRGTNSLRGDTRAAKVALRDRVFLSALRAELSYDPATIELADIRARAAKGELDGNFSVQPQAQDSPFAVHANFRQVQADELVVEAGGPKDVVLGVLEGTLDASGKIADRAALTGAGTVVLHGGHVQQFALLAAIGQVLQIEELTQLDLEQAEAKYRLAGNTVLIDELVLRSPNLRLNAAGSVNFNGKVALDSKLTINDKIRGQLFRGMRENFAATEQPGEYSLPFHIGGTLDKPKTDLVQRAVGVDVKNIGGVIDALFGRGKNRKKKGAENLASPAPSSSELPAFSPSLTPAPTP